MSIHYNTKINNNGLILYVDAQNPKSYPGTGSTWYDISGFKNHGTLLNSPTFNSDGTFSFDGTNHAVSFGTYSSMTSVDNKEVSIDVWTNFNFANSPGPQTARGFAGFYTSNADYLSIKGNVNVFADVEDAAAARILVPITNFAITDYYDKWCNFTLVHTNKVTKIYYNGQYYNTGTSVNDVTFQDNVFNIGGGDGYFRFYGKMSNVKLYNRALTGIEITQNFNAQRSRFGL